MKKIYIIPKIDLYKISGEGAILLEYSQTKPGGGGNQEENEFSKGGGSSMWEYMDDED